MTTGATRKPSRGRVHLQAYPELGVETAEVGKISCNHSAGFFVTWSFVFCGLCFLREGYSDELPGRLHHVHELAENGNPRQTDRLNSHVQVIEGLFPPLQNQSVRSFSRARGQLGSHPAPNIFPFASAIWEVLGKQPPLGWPLYEAVRGVAIPEIARNMDLSLYNVNERIMKGVDMAARIIRKYDNDGRERNAARSTAENDAADS